MEISKLGEVGLIQRMVAPFKESKQASTLLGVGDDAALLAPERGEELLVSTELMLEGIHFDLVYFPLKYLGFKAVTVAVSDIIASGGVPRQLLLGLGISQRFQVEDVEVFMSGVQEALDFYGMDLIGGDTTSSLTGFSVSVTALGSVKKGEMVQRSGAKANDLICLTGDVGAAFMGLQLLMREKVAYDGTAEFAPKFEGREYILQRQLRPVAPLDQLRQLQSAGIRPTAMIDVTDGVASDLLQICSASGVGCRIYEERLPVDYETFAMAEEMGFSELTSALHGGDDFELLFTAPLGMKDLLDSLQGVHQIGFITEDGSGCQLVTRAGAEVSLTAQAFPKGI